jgi:hypothetical protein
MRGEHTRAVGSASNHQHPLTVVAKVPGSRQALVDDLTSCNERVLARLAEVDTLHYARFVVFEGNDGAARLAFESNYDGDEASHLHELEQRLGADLEVILGHCEGYTRGDFAGFVRSHRVLPSMYYRAHMGLTARQIRNDRDVRRAIQSWLDAEDAARRLETLRPAEIAHGLVAAVRAAGLQIGPVDRGLPAQPEGWMGLLAQLLSFYLPAELGLAGIAALAFEPRDAIDERLHPPVLISEHDPGLDALIVEEDAQSQNGLTVVVPVKPWLFGKSVGGKPGLFRLTALRLALSAVEQAHRRLYYKGTLGGIPSIHFARWALLDDGTLLFLSDYDGSWDNYLSDFIDKSHWFLTAIWTNTRWFPDTHALLFKGATAELRFKQWTRTFQVPNQIWYSAYEELSVRNVLDNANVRTLAGGPLQTPGDIHQFLRAVSVPGAPQ